jgi:hypothetical protein
VIGIPSSGEGGSTIERVADITTIIAIIRPVIGAIVTTV